VDASTLSDMTPLLGSTKDSQVLLANERVVVYDASSAMTATDLKSVPVVSASDASFLTSPGTAAFRAQSHFYWVNNAYARTHALMAGRWESLLPLLGIESGIPPAEFAPRVIVQTDVSSSVACPGNPACASIAPFPFTNPKDVLDEYEQPFNTPPFEVVAIMYLKNSNYLSLVAHEFGHVIDYFAHPGVIDHGVHCTGQPGCAASCAEDTTDEATPLRESFANLASIWLGHELTVIGQDPANCSYVSDISRGVNRLPHNDACRPDGDPFPRLIRDDDPACPAEDVCDKPSSPGYVYDGQNDVYAPTGACEEGGVDGGYKVDSFFQALWEALHAQTCSEAPPYTCQHLTALAQAGDSGDVQGGALLYAARVNSMTYRAFASDMATYIACNYGEDAYLEFNQVACHHGLRDCDAGVPLSCEVCGDNQRQGGEACDGADLGGSTCETLGLSGGTLSCTGSCVFDMSMCTTNMGGDDESGAPTGEPAPGPVPTTSGDGDGTSATSGQTEATTSGASVGPGDESCACRQDKHTASWPAWLLAGVLTRRRRLRKPGRTAALLWGALALPGTGCTAKEDPGVPTVTGGEASSGGLTSASESDEDTASSSSEPMVPTRLLGAFHSEEYTDGLKWEQPFLDDMIIFWAWWGNVLIAPDFTLQYEWYLCGGPPEVQSFTWEPDGDGIRIVPPNGEGKPFKFAADEVWEITIRPGEACGEIVLNGQSSASKKPYPPSTYVAGHLCATDVSPTFCEFEFKWCEGPPAPPVCE
jgi:hypothetical protein